MLSATILFEIHDSMKSIFFRGVPGRIGQLQLKLHVGACPFLQREPPTRDDKLLLR